MSSQAEKLEHMLRKLLANQRFSRLVVMEQKKLTQTLPGSQQKELRVSDKKMASQARQNQTFGTSTSTSTYGKVEGLDVTLDDPAGIADRSWWIMGCKCMIYE